jgi:hypothetical protein
LGVDGNRSKRYSLVLPRDLYDEIEKLAQSRHTTVVDVMRRFLKLGLLVARAEASPDAALVIREGDTEREVIFL